MAKHRQNYPKRQKCRKNQIKILKNSQKTFKNIEKNVEMAKTVKKQS